MSIKRDVFGSNSERENYYKLCRAWGDHYRIYHNLPFLNVFDTSNLIDLSQWPPREVTVTPGELRYLQATTIDYTLCDEKDRPLLCVEFDGLQDGTNVGSKYYAGRRFDFKRQEKFEVKLKVAHGSLFPFFVVGYRYFRDLGKDIKLTIVDGIIGDILAGNATRERFAKGVSSEDLGMTDEEYESLQEWERDELIQDWAVVVEVEEMIKHNPIIRARANLERQLEVRSWSEEFLHDPRVEQAKTLRERAKLIEQSVRHGAKCTLHTDDVGDVEGVIWMANFNTPWFSGISLLTELSALLALQRLKQIRGQREGNCA